MPNGCRQDYTPRVLIQGQIRLLFRNTDSAGLEVMWAPLRNQTIFQLLIKDVSNKQIVSSLCSRESVLDAKNPALQWNKSDMDTCYTVWFVHYEIWANPDICIYYI